jgi:hypothetical protein
VGHHVPQQGGVGGDAGDEVGAAVLVVLPHLQAEQPPHKAVAQLPYDALPHAFENETAHRAGCRFGDEQRSQEQQQGAQYLSASAGVHDLFRDEWLSQAESGADECERGGDEGRCAVPVGQSVHGGDCGVRGAVIFSGRLGLVCDGLGHRPDRVEAAIVMSRVK